MEKIITPEEQGKLITKIGNSNFKLDLPNNRIDFLDTRFYITESGAYVPSVTTILECYPKGNAFYEWLKTVGHEADNIRDEGGDKGSTIHMLTEKYDLGEDVNLMDKNGFIGYKLFEWHCFEKYVEFRQRFEVEIHSIETRITSDTLDIGGTLDRDMTLKINGKRYLVDIKSSQNIWEEYWIQMCAYQKIYEDVNKIDPFDGRAILWLNAKTKTDGKKGAIQGKGWQLLIDEEDVNEGWEIFKATQKLWKVKNENSKPRQTSYQLTHKLKTAI